MKRSCVFFALALILTACRGGNPGVLPSNATPAGKISAVPALASGLAFVPIGPTHMTSGNYPNSGKLNAFAVDPTNPKVIYTAGGRGTGLETYSSAGAYRTDDGGSSWTAIDSGLTDSSGVTSSAVNALWVDPHDSSTLLAATEFDGIFRSRDRGGSWHSVYRTTHATQFAFFSGTLYASSDAGILASTDAGASWHVAFAGTAQRSPTAFGSAGKRLYAGMSDGTMFRLAGSRWVMTGTLPYDAHTGTDGSTPAVHQIAVDPLTPATLYASSNDGSWDQDLHASTDGGKTWNTILKSRYGRYGLGTQAIAFSQVHPHTLYVGADGLLYVISGDGAATPKAQLGALLTVIDIRDIWTVANGKDDACWVASDQGLDYEPACSTVTRSKTDNVVSSTLATGLARRFVVSPNGKTILVSLQDFGSHATFDGGKTWHENYVLYEDGFNELAPNNPSTCYAFDEASGFLISTDGCHTYIRPSHQAKNLLPSRLMTTPIAFDPANPSKIYLASGAIVGAGFPPAPQAVFVTTDGGKSFGRLAWPIAQPGAIVVDHRDGSHILVGGLKNQKASSISVTFDGGKTWTQSTGVPATGFWYSATISPIDSNTVLASSVDASNNVFVLRSIDGGKSFSNVATVTNAPLIRGRYDADLIERGAPPQAFVYSPAREIRFNQDAVKGTPDVVLTTLRGAYLSSDYGKTWQRLDRGLISHSFWGIRWNRGYLYLGSDGQGIVRSTTRVQ